MDEEHFRYVFRLNTTPLLLGNVCGKWRTIALATPRLWTSFSLTIQPKYLKSDVVLAKTWLARAGKCPLTIHLASRGNYPDTTPLVEVFLLHSEQWYDIHLSVPLSVLGSLAPAKDHLPSLQKLHLGLEFEGAIEIFKSAPQLRWLRLTSSITQSMANVSCRFISFASVEGHWFGDNCAAQRQRHTLDLLWKYNANDKLL